MRLRHLLHKYPCLDLNHAESASVGKYHCGDKHESGNYKGICIGLIHDAACNRVCIDESSDNSGGICDFLQCWCITRCTSETEAVASAPIQQWYNDPRLNNDPILPSHRLIIIYNIVYSVYLPVAYLCCVVDLWVKINLYFLVQILLTIKIGMSGKNRSASLNANWISPLRSSCRAIKMHI